MRVHYEALAMQIVALTWNTVFTTALIIPVDEWEMVAKNPAHAID